MIVENCPLCKENDLFKVHCCREWGCHHPLSADLGRCSTPNRAAFEEESRRIVREVEAGDPTVPVVERVRKARGLALTIENETRVTGFPRPTDHVRSVERKGWLRRAFARVGRLFR